MASPEWTAQLKTLAAQAKADGLLFPVEFLGRGGIRAVTVFMVRHPETHDDCECFTVHDAATLENYACGDDKEQATRFAQDRLDYHDEIGSLVAD